MNLGEKLLQICYLRAAGFSIKGEGHLLTAKVSVKFGVRFFI